MTIYTIELMKILSLSRLPTAHTLIALCLHVSECILKSLSSSLETNNLREHKIIAKHIINLNECLDLMNKTIPGKTDTYPIKVIHLSIIGCKHGQKEFNQIFTMTTLGGVHPVTLIEILSTLLNNSLTCIKTYLPSVPEILVSECEANFNIIIHDLFAIFPKMNTFILLKFTSIKLRVEFDDKKDDIKNIS
jgi:hypothetical protein